MLIYDALKKDHDMVKDLLNQLVNLSDDQGKVRSDLIAKIRDELIPHSRAEEAVFYNSMRMLDTSKKLAMHGYAEHMAAETLLRTLQVEDKAGGIAWKATALKLQEALAHHIEEEEGEMFRAARQLFTEEEATMMADAFEKMKPEVKEEGFMGTTLEMIKNLMPPRLTMAVEEKTREWAGKAKGLGENPAQNRH